MEVGIHACWRIFSGDEGPPLKIYECTWLEKLLRQLESVKRQLPSAADVLAQLEGMLCSVCKALAQTPVGVSVVCCEV